MAQKLPLVIVGGNSLVASYLMRHLGSYGQSIEVISRRPVSVPEGFIYTQMDLAQARNWIAPENAIVVSLLPLWILAQYLPRFIGVQSIVAVGSTSRFSKAASADVLERKTAENLEMAEHALQNWCERSNVKGILLRSTLIYDGVADNNIARMARFIKRFRFLPLAAPALGLRQPIHADDVARIVIKCLDNEAAYGKALNIAGGEVLTYRAMAERVFTAHHIKPRFLLLPTRWLEKGFHWASDMGLVHETAFGASIFQRMNQNLIFDLEEGIRLIGYKARPFEPLLLPDPEGLRLPEAL